MDNRGIRADFLLGARYRETQLSEMWCHLPFANIADGVGICHSRNTSCQSARFARRVGERAAVEKVSE